MARSGQGGLLGRWADWFEQRGVYVPGEDNRTVSRGAISAG